MASGSRLQVFHVALIDYLSTQSAGMRADVDDVVGRTDDFFVMFHDYHRIAQLLQLAQHFDEAARIPTMQADTWFIQYIERTHQATSQGSG